MIPELSDVLYSIAYGSAAMILASVVYICIYDIKYASYWREFNRRCTKPLRTRPHITIVIYIQNDIRDLEACLRSIWQNKTYRNYDVVVADNASHRLVRSQTRNLLRRQRQSVYYYANRRRSSMDRVYREAYKRSERGDLVLLLTSHDILAPRMLKSLAVLQSTLPTTNYFELSFSYFQELSLEAVIRELRFAHQGIIKKMRLFRSKTNASLRPGVAMRSELLAKHQPKARSVYVPQVSLVRKSLFHQESYSVWTRVGGLLAGLAGLAVLGVCLTLAATSDVDQPLVVAWVLAAVWTIIVVIQLQTIGIRQKFHLFAVAPLSIFMYVTVFILDLAYYAWNLLTYRLLGYSKINYMREFSYKLQLAFLYY